MTKRLVALATVIVLAGTIALPSALAGDPLVPILKRSLQQDIQRYPRVTRAALAQVLGRPLFFQVVYVSGAIGSAYVQSGCTLAEVDPTGFDRVAQRTLFKRAADYQYVRSHGWSVQSVLKTYRHGIVFGCNY